MALALRRAMTREDFLLWVEGQEGRFEFDGVQPVAMTAGTNAHGLITRNLHGHLFNRLRGARCQSMTAEGGGVAIPGDKVRYPDATVTCSPIVGTDRLVPDPVVVFEIVSSSSMREDTVVKLLEYQTVATIRRYVLIEQARIAVTSHWRDHGPFTIAPTLGSRGVLDLPEIGITIAVDDLYEGVSFAD